jgi:hypothetical protein
MKRPSFQFYPGDWAANPNLKRCTFAEKGIWLEVMCLMHDQAEYGVLRWPLKEVAEAVKCRTAELLALVRKGVLKGDDKHLEAPYIYTPRSGRKDGEPVTLVPIQPGPVWYSSRMVKDEYVRTIRGEGTRFGDDKGDGPKGAPKPPFGDGPSSSSSSPPSGKEITKLSLGRDRPSDAPPQLSLVEPGPERPKGPPDCPHLHVLALWAEVLPQLPQHEPDQWKGQRADHLRARWREVATAKGWTGQEAGLAYLRRLFAYVGRSPFLTGRVTPRDPNKRLFVVTLAWLVKPENWAKTVEGEYHEESA